MSGSKILWCQEAKFYDVNSVNKKSWCRKSCKFASFSRKPAILMGEKRKPLWCYKTLIWKFYVILLFRCYKSCKTKLQLQNDLLPCNASHPKSVLNACFHVQHRSPCRLLTQCWALQKLTGNISSVSNWPQKTHLSNVHTEYIEAFFVTLSQADIMRYNLSAELMTHFVVAGWTRRSKLRKMNKAASDEGQTQREIVLI